MTILHVKNNTIGDFTGTVTVLNSQGSTVTVAASNLVRPSDWNSGHNINWSVTGNTTQNSTGSNTALLFRGEGGVSVGGSNGSIVISGGAAAGVTGEGHHPYDDLVQVVGQVGQGTLQFDPQYMPDFAFDRIGVFIQNTNSSNSSGSHTLSFWIGLYTRNGASLSLLSSFSGSTAVTHSGTAGSYSRYSGGRLFTFGATATVSARRYWIGFLSRTTSGGANGSYSNYMVSNIASQFTGMFGTASDATHQPRLGQGYYSATTSGIPGSVAFSQIQGTNSLARRFPVVGFHSSTY